MSILGQPSRLADFEESEEANVGRDGELNSPLVEVWFDGSCLDNQTPEKSRAGFGYLVECDGERIQEGSGFLGHGEKVTNNRAEYDALIRALEWIDEHFADASLRIVGDSELIINQVTGEWRTKDPALQDRRADVQELLSEFDGHELEQVSESESDRIARADALAEKAAGSVEMSDGGNHDD